MVSISFERRFHLEKKERKRLYQTAIMSCVMLRDLFIICSPVL